MKLKNIIIIFIIIKSFHIYAEIPDSYPIKTKFNITQAYGFKENPFTGTKTQYNDIKLLFTRETDIYPTGSGNIKKIDNKMNLYNVQIDHGNGFITELKNLENVLVQVNDSVTKETLISRYSYRLDNIYGKTLQYTIKYNDTYINPEILILKDLTKDEKVNLNILTSEITNDYRKALDNKKVVNINDKNLVLDKDILINRNWGTSYFNDIGYQLEFFDNNTYLIYFSYQGYHGVMGNYEIINNQIILTPKMNSPYLMWNDYNSIQTLELLKNYQSLDSLVELRNINNATKFSDINSPPDYNTIKEIGSIKIYNFEQKETNIITDSVVYIDPANNNNFYKFNINENKRVSLPQKHKIIPIARSTNKIDLDGKNEFIYYCKLKLTGWDHALEEVNGQEVQVMEPSGWIFESNLDNDYISTINTKYQ